MGTDFAQRLSRPSTPMRADAQHTAPQPSSTRASRFEDEADRAAARVMQHIDPGVASANLAESLDRHLSHGHRITAASGRTGAKSVLGDESRSLDGRRPVDSTDLVPRHRGEPLPHPLGRQMGEALGADLSGVRIHAGEEGHSVASAHDAFAVTKGRDVYFGQGMYQPDDRAGRAMLAHELAHTVQQGAVPTAAGGGPAAGGLSAGSARLAGPQRSGARAGLERMAEQHHIESELRRIDPQTRMEQATYENHDLFSSGPGPISRQILYNYDTAEGAQNAFRQGSLPLSPGVPPNQTAFPQGLYGSDIPPYATSYQSGSGRRPLSQPRLATSFYADYGAYRYRTEHASPVSHYTAFIGDDFTPHGSVFPGMRHYVRPEPFRRTPEGQPERRPVTMIATGRNLMPEDEPHIIHAFSQPNIKRDQYMTPTEATSVLNSAERPRTGFRSWLHSPDTARRFDEFMRSGGGRD